MTGEDKKQIRALCDKIFERGQYGIHGSSAFDEKVDDFLKELEKLWPKRARDLGLNIEIEDDSLLSADPLGADRHRRTLPHPAFDPKVHHITTAVRCSCPAGKGTDPGCPVHP